MTETQSATHELRPTLADRVGALEREVRALHATLEASRAALADEVRTHRVVVVDRGGFERIIAEAGPSRARLVVHAPAVERGSTTVELFADDPIDGDPANVGVVLAHAGDIVAALEVAGRGRPGLWLADPDEP